MMHTEDQVKALLDLAHTEDYDTIARLRILLEECKFGRAVAEWAIAGIVNRNVQVTMMLDSGVARDPPPGMIQHLSRQTALQLLHEAKLQFTKHAKYAELERTVRVSPSMQYALDPDKVPSAEYWPRPC